MNTTTTKTHRDFTFGVELETIGPNVRNAAKAIATAMGWTYEEGYGSHGEEGRAVMPDGRVWTAVIDGSIGYSNAEVVSPILSYTDMETLQEVARALRKAGARTNDSCGMHVHVGCKDMSAKAMCNLINLAARFDGVIKSGAQVLTSRAYWCQPVHATVVAAIARKSPKTISALETVWYENTRHLPRCDRPVAVRRGAHYDSSRYCGLNLHSFFYSHAGATPRRTAEFRYFNGTLHAGVIRANVLLALSMVARAANVRSVKYVPMAVDATRAKYQMRMFMRDLRMVGPEFENPRTHLLKHLPGAGTWREIVRAQRMAVAA